MKKHTSAKLPSIEVMAKEHHHHEKNSLWYVGISVLLAAGAAGALFEHEYLLALVIIAFGAAMFRLASLKPEIKKIEITPQGLLWGDTVYGFHQLKAFWAAETGDSVTLYIERLNFLPLLTAVLSQNQAQKLMEPLAEFLPWHDHRTEPIADRFNRLLRF